ncbi:2-aminoethylphosphonate--pyruvate transaminase [Halobacillus shinanisalinarum]|uniref:2-aminoethylphosphonate--pyruvate transaminase n=1 Tax=Halobacillus shinanisalinarum TaxID=2932258 RepID=A0ABY4H3D9_9BACI|nr:2-aminoethylphosphonate--pyruvate transaminase [Halobacillus shinanisalinarum]UOQ94869.1 2-aminoethylphosphonate--pyruvate transaminase [Halobacillus shinanisalinarum]
MKNDYLLLTPGPLSTSETVRKAMLQDWCTWDADYNQLVQKVRERLVTLSTRETDSYTSVLMQGSGSFTVESVLGTVMPKTGGKLLVCTNGAYGDRIVKMCEVLGIETVVVEEEEHMAIDPSTVEAHLGNDPTISHVVVVHCETTTGILNPAQEICAAAKRYGKTTIVDAMSSFGGIPMDVHDWGIDFLISSANKCIQGVPGFGFCIAKKKELEKCKDNARSLSLDMYSQYETMENNSGKWRYTSPTHVVRAFYQALLELEEEGGVQARHRRYIQNQQLLVQGMEKLGFSAHIKEEQQSPIITSFLFPDDPTFTFQEFYQTLKKKGFVIYPGKISEINTFRIGNIGEVYPKDMERLLDVIQETCSNWEHTFV